MRSLFNGVSLEFALDRPSYGMRATPLGTKPIGEFQQWNWIPIGKCPPNPIGFQLEIK
jgi:hypothetical protein